MVRLVEVTIGNAQYTIKTDADAAYIQSIAKHVNSKIEEIQNKTRSVSTINVVILAALNIADDLFREKGRNRKYVKEIEDRSRQLIDIIEKEV
ncbi:MAG: cell division protein ZapA [candidate division Zixibacteria bacterium]|nr:cell division protein ZapA [candidate division Zixibacteria bacterium]